ncbi:hypothetical protein [Streptomyces sp. NPDC058495]|uniref:hypothetical protein n=1 Tax=unclassified Streptomyces TaxID=2593676 RepID=UPI0036648D86
MNRQNRLPDDRFANAVFVRGEEPVEDLVVRLDRIGSGLTSPLDYPVMLHAMVVLEEWQRWGGEPRRRGDPEPEFSESVVLRRLEAAGVAWPGGRRITVEEVRESLCRLAAAGAVRGLRVQGGAL